jgi:hypothetical protein
MVEPKPPSRRRPPLSTWAGASWAIIEAPSTSAGPCDAIFDSCDAEDRSRRRLLLLLPASGLLRRLLRRCLRLSLLRHCCPPSLSGWRHRCSAVANRHALLSDYYSRKKITVTPINFVCRGRAPPPRRKRRAISRKLARGQIFFATQARQKNARDGEVPMKCGFSSRVGARVSVERARIAPSRRALSRP